MTMQRIHTTPRASRGFTLIELMIVVAVISILGAIAYPSYQESVRKGRRAEGRAALQELMQQQERYMTQFNTYSNVFAAGATNVPFKTESEGGKYKLQAALCDGKSDTKTCIKLIAVPQISDPKAGNLILSSHPLAALGNKTKDCTGNDKRTCWP